MPEEVKSFWDRRAADPSLDAAQVTHPDIWQRWLEIETLKRLVMPNMRVVDIGCGAGYVTKLLAPFVQEIIGLDFSEGMIERARLQGEPPPRNASFAVADILAPTRDLGLFDLAFSIRCLINITDWDAQKRALANIASLVKPRGLYVFMEGSSAGRAELNRLRETVGLEPMPTVWHNRDFEPNETLDYLSNYFRLEREIGFGTYDLVARVVHPQLVRPNTPDYCAPINEIAARTALARPDDIRNSRVAVYCLRRH